MHAAFINPVLDAPDLTDQGDPFVLPYAGGYFLFHTTDDGTRPVAVHRSADLVSWERAGDALGGGPPGAETDLWAPEVLPVGDHLTMYLAATGPAGPGHHPLARAAGEGADHGRRQWTATAAAPTGPFRWDPHPLLGGWAIDGHPFLDEDGALWLFYNIHGDYSPDAPDIGLAAGTGIVVDRLVAPDRLEGRPAPVVIPSQDWESNHAGTFRWNEGPWVMKRRGRYVLMYSGGHYRESTYGLGIARASTPRGPWRKDPHNPILTSGRRITGPGHHCVVTAPDGVTPYVVYHGYVVGRPGAGPGPGQLGGGRKVHLDRLRWAGPLPHIGTPEQFPGVPTEHPQSRPPGPVHDPDVPHWHEEAWIEGDAATVGDVAVDLGGPGLHRLRASCVAGRLEIRVDGRLRHRGPAGGAGVGASGDVRHRARTSHLEDQALHDLAPGGVVRWAWHGAGPLEVCVAVRGAATVHAGAEAREVFSPADRFDLASFMVPGGAESVEVRAGPGGASVTDAFLAAREPGWAVEYDPRGMPPLP